MKRIYLISLTIFLLAGCGGKIDLVSPNPGGSNGFTAELVGSPIWNVSARTLTFFFYCHPPSNSTIISIWGDFAGPTSGKVDITYDYNTYNGQGIAVLPIDGTYKISVYVKDSSGKTTLVLQFTFIASGSGGGGSGGGGGGGSGNDTPPPPPF